MWLDHCISTADAHSSLTQMEILYMSTSDHIPVKMTIRFNNVPNTVKCANNYKPALVFWASLSEDITSYFSCTDVLLRNLYLPMEAISCRNNNCTNLKHKTNVVELYNPIVSSLLVASKPLCRPKKKGKATPGWNACVAEFYTEACEATNSWALAGRPRQGPLFEYKKYTNAKYKYAVRYVKKYEQPLRADSMARKLLCKNTKTYWKGVRQANNCKLSRPNPIKQAMLKR